MVAGGLRDAPYAQWKKEEGESKRTRKLPGMPGRRRGEGQENQEYEIREAAQRRAHPRPCERKNESGQREYECPACAGEQKHAGSSEGSSNCGRTARHAKSKDGTRLSLSQRTLRSRS